MLSPPPPPPAPYQQQHIAFAPGPSYSAADLNIPPPPLSNQTSTTLFQPYDDQDHDLGDAGDLPLLRAPSGRSQESLRIPGQYGAPLDDEGANNIRYGRIPQRVPRRHKTLKRVECVDCSTCLRIRLADPFRSPRVVQALPRQFCARLGSPNKAA